MPTNTEHVVITSDGSVYRLLCKRCFDADELKTPMDTRTLIWLLRDFLDAHRGCEWPSLDEHTGIPPGHSSGAN